ncbi:MAG: esterase, partial [Bacteroidia bacterium]|nr:esterase [Bacteroidia bacterium]
MFCPLRISLFVFLWILWINASAQPLPKASPEQVGMDSKRLKNADNVIQKAIADKEIPGAVLAVVRDGKMAYLKTYGNKQIV